MKMKPFECDMPRNFMPRTFHKKRQHETHYIRKHKKICGDEETLD